MCGLFGLARPGQDGRPAAVVRAEVEALVMLGVLAEERGTDAAGLAMWRGPARAPGKTEAGGSGNARVRSIARFTDVRVGGWRVIKRAGPFRRLPDQPGLALDLTAARVVLGHTRWATQGAARRVINASPLAVGRVLGTHNGDLDAERLAASSAFPGPLGRRVGQTDSAVLFAGLDAAGSDRAAVLRLLAAVRGRAAVAWVDRTRAGTVWLARAALSPLAVAETEDGAVFWASNPDWLRRAGQHCGLTWRHVTMLPEGTLVRVRAGSGAVTLAGQWSFQPLARRVDVRLADLVVWRGFTRADRDADQGALRHVVDSPPLSPWWSGSYRWPDGPDDLLREEDLVGADARPRPGTDRWHDGWDGGWDDSDLWVDRRTSRNRAAAGAGVGAEESEVA